MCGIAGTTTGNKETVSRMLEATKHRGPDSQGMVTVRGVSMGVNRLAILDLRPEGDQPFKFPSDIFGQKNYLCYNGEVWNWKELREDLKDYYEFETECDTEVVAAVLTEYGIGGLERLDGMFALFWMDSQSCYLARDRFGKIPLWVNLESGLFSEGVTWCSERKGLKEAGLTNSALVPPGSYLDVRSKKLHKWYDLKKNIKPRSLDLLKSLRSSVEVRLRADVPVCCLISGGLDSSLILKIAKEINPDIVAYTAILDESKPDLLSARRLCEELEVRLIEVPIPYPTVELLKEACLSVESNLKTQVEIGAVAIPLAKQIRKDGFRVALSGEGADELFGGYGSMIIPSRKASDEQWRNTRLKQLEKMSRGNFLRCSNAFLAHGVECRLPYLSRELVEYVLSLGKAECPPGKGLLKEIAKGVIPEWVIKREKDTFQGGVGMIDAAERVLTSPKKFYSNWIADAYGKEGKLWAGTITES